MTRSNSTRPRLWRCASRSMLLVAGLGVMLAMLGGTGSALAAPVSHRASAHIAVSVTEVSCAKSAQVASGAAFTVSASSGCGQVMLTTINFGRSDP